MAGIACTHTTNLCFLSLRMASSWSYVVWSQPQSRVVLEHRETSDPNLEA